jgi:hypothetical protein
MHLLPETMYLFSLERGQRKFDALSYSRYFVGVCCTNYKGILYRLNLPTLYSTWRHLDGTVSIKAFKNKINCSSIFDSVSVRIPARIIKRLHFIYGKSQFQGQSISYMFFCCQCYLQGHGYFLTKIIFFLWTFHNITSY